jgi:hypothetical protein
MRGEGILVLNKVRASEGRVEWLLEELKQNHTIEAGLG